MTSTPQWACGDILAPASRALLTPISLFCTCTTVPGTLFGVTHCVGMRGHRTVAAQVYNTYTRANRTANIHTTTHRERRAHLRTPAKMVSLSRTRPASLVFERSFCCLVRPPMRVHHLLFPAALASGSAPSAARLPARNTQSPHGCSLRVHRRSRQWPA